MATFSIDLLTGKQYLFNGNFTNSGMTTFTGVTSVDNGLSMVTSQRAKLGGTLNCSTIITIGAGNTAGIEYGGNYSASFSNRSLVDKGYVDDKVSGNTPSWLTLTNRPAWLTGTTLSAFQLAHTHSQYLTSSALNGYWTSAQTTNYLSNRYWTSGQTVSYVNSRNFLTGVTWSEVSNKPSWVGSGGTTVYFIGNQYRIYSTLPTGTTASWNDITSKPSWLSGVTLAAFETGHTHSQYLTISALNGYWNSGQTISYINGRNFLTGVTWSQVQSKPSWVGSGETIVELVGNTYRIYTPTDLTTTWSTLTGRPAWLTGTTLGAFETGHTHSYSNLTNKLTFTQSGITVVTQNGNNVNIYVPSTNVTLQLIDISGGTEVNTISATTITWTTQEFTGTTFSFTGGSKIHITQNGIYGIGYMLNFINEDSTPKNIGSVIRKNGNLAITPTTSAAVSTFPFYSATNILSIYKTNLLAGDYVELTAYRIGDAGNATTVPSGSWITLIKYNT
jgi:hypothetical protein